MATGVNSRVGQFQKAGWRDAVPRRNRRSQPDRSGQNSARSAGARLERVGGRTSIPVDVRLLAATNKDLEAEIVKGTFREDLYYRIKVIHIHMPPLREIRDEIPLLARSFPQGVLPRNKPGDDGVRARSRSQTDELRPWPGNVRQLRNEVMRLAACAPHNLIEEEDLWEGLPVTGRDEPAPPPVKLAIAEKGRRRDGETDDWRSPARNQEQSAAGRQTLRPEPSGADQ